MPTATETPSVLAALRGEPHERTSVDPDAVREVRRALGEAVHGHEGRFSARELRRNDPDIVPLRLATAALRGALVKGAVRLVGSGFTVEDHFRDAVDCWLASDPSAELRGALRELDREELELLKTEVTAHLVVLASRLTTVPGGWRPRFRASSSVIVDGVTLSDTVDVAVGSVHGPNASVALLDVTTSPLDESTARVLRYHALCETIRTGRWPWRVVQLSTATDELAVLTVTATELHLGVSDVARALEQR